MPPHLHTRRRIVLILSGVLTLLGCESIAHAEDSQSISFHEYEMGYDRGFYLRSGEADPHFEMVVNGRLQMRYGGFAPRNSVFVSRGGSVFDVGPRNEFEMERARLQFMGSAWRPELIYNFIIDGDSDGAGELSFLSYSFGYQFDPLFVVHLGRLKSAASREWWTSSKFLHLVDRSMATTFFRPGYNDGIEITGHAEDHGWHYRGMLSNGYVTSALTQNQLDDRISPSFSSWWEPLGDFGLWENDLDFSESPLIRIGMGSVYAPHRTEPTPNMGPNELNRNPFRLADGTLIVETGALAPGVTVQRFDVTMLSFDAAIKHRGASLSTEYYLRWFTSLRANGALPMNEIFQHGYYVQGGYFVIPHVLEFVLRQSAIFGEYDTAYEYAAGANWFLNGYDAVFQFDVTNLAQNPAQNGGPNLRSGDDGVMLRAQLQLAF